MSMFSQTKRIGLCAAVAVGAVVLAGCATLDQGTPEEIVAKKAQAYWDARLAGDTKKAYEFTAPSYRADNDLAQFANSAGRTYALSAKVKNVKCEADSCRSGMNLQIKPPFATMGAGTMDMYYAEKWVLEDGRWWLLMAP